MVYGVKCISEVQIAAEEPLPALCRFLDGPVQALFLPLRGVQPTEPLLPPRSPASHASRQADTSDP